MTDMNDKGYFVHQSSYVDENVEIGEGTRIWYFSHILRDARIGRNCVIGQNVCIESGVTIGDHCKIQNNVSVYKGVTLEDEVFCGPSCVFTNVYNPRAFIERKKEFRPTLVKRGATIGANATIVCGATIGRYALVAAGAVVKKDVPDYAVVAGVPVKQIGWACKCGTPLRFDSRRKAPKRAELESTHLPGALGVKQNILCAYCKNRYTLEGGKLVVVKES
jgi:UDP-2-acetamido-3-amino-2,3-dideoxy-glucuronate N-acetyltransferase